MTLLLRALALVGLGVLLGPAAAAQPATATLSGSVLDASGDPLPGATVVAVRLGRGAVTDPVGRFRLSGLPADTLTIHVSYVGYLHQDRLVDLRDGAATLEVRLEEGEALLDEVEVEARGADVELERAAHSVAVLEGEALDAARGQTLADALEQLPGVTTLSTGPAIEKPVIRGLYGDRVVVINNGIRQEGQQWGAEHAPEIDPFAPDRIEVVRGAAGVEYGVGAIGGVVRVDEAPLPERSGLGGQLSLQAFTNSGQGAGSATLQGGVSGVRGLGWRVQGSVRRAGDARTPDYVLGNTAFFERSAAASVGLARGPLQVEVHASRFQTDLGIYRGSHFNTFEGLETVLERGRPAVDYAFSYEIGAPKQEITHDLATVEASYRVAGLGRVEAQLGFQRNSREEFDADRLAGRDPLARPAFGLELFTQTAEVKATTLPRSFAGGDAFFVAGGSTMRQANDRTTGYLIPDFLAWTGGAFARGTWARGPVTLEAGARLDHRWQRAFPQRGNGFDRDVRSYTGLSGVLGAIWRIAPTWSLGTNLSTAWRPPSINELYTEGVHHGTAQFETGNAALTGERALGADLTLRHQSARVRAEVSAYAQRIGDYIFLQPTGEAVVTIRGVFPGFTYAQTDALVAGLDGFVQADLGPVTLGATAALVRGTDTAADEPLLTIPADRIGLTAAYRLPDLGLVEESEVEVGARLVREQDRFPTRFDPVLGREVPVDYVAPPSGYAVFDVGFSTRLVMGRTPVRLSLSIENLLDTRYRDYLSRYRYFALDPGRSAVLRLSVPFGAF